MGAKRILIIAITIILVVLGWRYSTLYKQASMYYLQVSFRSSVQGKTQLFYDRGRGFNEKDSIKQNAWEDSQFNYLRFQLPRETFYKFRFDPFPAFGTMYLKNMEIKNGLGHRLKAIDLHHWQPANQIKKFYFRNNELVIVTEEGFSDPQMVLKLGNPLKFDRTHSVLTVPLMGRAALELIIVTIMVAMMLITIIKMKIKFTAMGQIELFMLMDAFSLLASLFLFYVYFKGKWKDSIAFIHSLFNG